MMTARDLTYETGWLTLAGLLVSFHRLAVGFYLSDASHQDGLLSIALVGLGGLSAVVLTGAQMVLASTLAKIRDRLLEVAWWILLTCAVIVMSASTLASMHGASLAEVLRPEWLAARLPAVILAIGLSLAIEISLAAIRRASMLLDLAQESEPLHLAPHEVAELEVQRELARSREGEPREETPRDDEPIEPIAEEGPGDAKEVDEADEKEVETFTQSCAWCDWQATRPTPRAALNSVNAHKRFCAERPEA